MELLPIIIFAASAIGVWTIIVQTTMKRIEVHDQITLDRPYFDNWYTINFVQFIDQSKALISVYSKKVLKVILISVARAVYWIAMRVVKLAEKLAHQMDETIHETEQ